jgi:hypothetical protein
VWGEIGKLPERTSEDWELSVNNILPTENSSL